MIRPTPVGPPGAYRTYAIRAPVETHTRPATCAEARCARLAEGFQLAVDEATDLGRRQAAYLRAECLPLGLAAAAGHRGRRRYRESREAGLTVFRFPAGTPCFVEHRLPVDRPHLFIVRDGDWRGNPSGRVRRHDLPEHWVEDFAGHQDRIATVRERG